MPNRASLVLLVAPALPIALVALACSSSTATSAGEDAGGDASGSSSGGSSGSSGSSGAEAGPLPPEDSGPPPAVPYTDGPLKGCIKDPGAPAVAPVTSATDPVGPASFGIDRALAGYPATQGQLTALVTTEQGTIKCTLAEKEAPVSVANFVGLARGSRLAMKAPKQWTATRFYDGLVWHRVIPDFVIQGGDPLGNGTGGSGYDLPNENHVDEPKGTLAMAAAKAPSGCQFYIVVGTGPKADYNVFGTCETETAVKIASVPVDADDKPTTDVHIQRVDIARCP